MTGARTELDALVDRSPVIPVATFDDPESAVAASRALVEGGIDLIEITLRTPRALECISAVADAVPGMLVGAGTILDEVQVDAAVRSGARFLVSPGSTERLLDGMAASGLPFLPGVSTVSEAMALRERGLRVAKFFPAAAAGGPAALRAMAAPMPDMRFCPTGGITAESALDYLACVNVVCVGGSWLTAERLLAAGDYDAVRRLARSAARLARAA